MANNTQSSINRAIKDFERVSKQIYNSYDDTTKKLLVDGVKELKRTSNRRARNAPYANSWTFTIKRGRTLPTATIYNDGHGSLTHLLEYGHRTRNGGYTRATPHIRQVYEDISKKFTKDLASNINNKL